MTDKKERVALVPCVFLLLERDGKMLLSLRRNTGHMDGHYSLVAGHIEAGEAMSTAMIREAKEEAGITIQPEDLHEVVTMHLSGGDYGVYFFFTAARWEGEIANMEPERCSDLSWFPIGEMPENVIPYIREAIGCFQTGKTYVEFGF